jgi:hypothetical protein
MAVTTDIQTVVVTSTVTNNGVSTTVDAPVAVSVQTGGGTTSVTEMQGPRGVAGRDGTNGTNGTDGLSAYQVAVANGFVGNLSAWLASLQGAAGASAYQVAVTNGFVGTQAEWLASLQANVDAELAFRPRMTSWGAPLVAPSVDDYFGPWTRWGFVIQNPDTGRFFELEVADTSNGAPAVAGTIWAGTGDWSEYYGIGAVSTPSGRYQITGTRGW